MKKIIVVLFVIALLSVSLVACNPTDNSNICSKLADNVDGYNTCVRTLNSGIPQVNIVKDNADFYNTLDK
jgi:hypothetical protein